MAIIKVINSGAPIETALKYITKEEKTDESLIFGINCDPEDAAADMKATKERFGKTGGRTYKHYVMSFHAGERVTPQQALDIAIELAGRTEAWKDYEVLMAVHNDREHVHVHFIVNSVRITDGRKLRWNKHDLVKMKEDCNELCRARGLSVPEKGKDFYGQPRNSVTAYSKDTYQKLGKGLTWKDSAESYLVDIYAAVVTVSRYAEDRREFVRLMDKLGYGVNWTDARKYITFTDKKRQAAGEKRCRVRNSTLGNYLARDLSKAKLEESFRRNREFSRDPRRRYVPVDFHLSASRTPDDLAEVLKAVEAYDRAYRRMNSMITIIPMNNHDSEVKECVRKFRWCRRKIALQTEIQRNAKPRSHEWYRAGRAIRSLNRMQDEIHDRLFCMQCIGDPEEELRRVEQSETFRRRNNRENDEAMKQFSIAQKRLQSLAERCTPKQAEEIRQLTKDVNSWGTERLLAMLDERVKKQKEDEEIINEHIRRMEQQLRNTDEWIGHEQKAHGTERAAGRTDRPDEGRSRREGQRDPVEGNGDRKYPDLYEEASGSLRAEDPRTDRFPEIESGRAADDRRRTGSSVGAGGSSSSGREIHAVGDGWSAVGVQQTEKRIFSPEGRSGAPDRKYAGKHTEGAAEPSRLSAGKRKAESEGKRINGLSDHGSIGADGQQDRRPEDDPGVVCRDVDVPEKHGPRL